MTAATAGRFTSFSFGWGNDIGAWAHAWNAGKKDFTEWHAESVEAIVSMVEEAIPVAK